MTKVNRYIRMNYKKEDRYWTFDRVVEALHERPYICEPPYNEYFECPQCGEQNHKEDWNNCDELLPRCLHCRQIVVESEDD